MKKLTGMLVYVCVDKAIPCYDKEKGKEYKAGVVVDEDKVVGCHQCDWEVSSKSSGSIKVPKETTHSQIRQKINQIKKSKNWSTQKLVDELGIDVSEFKISHLNVGHQGMVLTFKVITHELNNPGSLDNL
jgi:hypothetical protein